MARPCVAKIDTDTYRHQLSQGPASVPLWNQPWWWDATAGAGKWSAVVVERGSTFCGGLPFTARRKRGVWQLGQPVVAQAAGPWLTEAVDSLGAQHQALRAIADALPSPHVYRQAWTVAQTNWLAFMWSGYQQTTRYTYRIDLSAGEDRLWKSLDSACRNKIRGAQNHGTSVSEATDVATPFTLNRERMNSQGIEIADRRTIFESIHRRGHANGQSQILAAISPDGVTLASCLLVFDSTTAYYLLGAQANGNSSKGAMNLLVWNAMLWAKAKGSTVFDFEGSVIEPIESFVRSFGSVQTPYFSVSGSPQRRVRQMLRLGLI